MSGPDLRGLRVLLTRPEPQNQALAEKLRQAGAQVRTLPMLALEPVPETPELRHRLMNLDLYQILVVVSPNAARIALESIDRYWPQLPVGIDWFCVGQGTRKVLRDYGIEAQAPEAGHDSEALLVLPRLQRVAGEKVLILRGEGGRDLIAQTLSQRGAQVEWAELYRRVVPEIGPRALRAALEDFAPQAILLYSGSTYEHLEALCRDHNLAFPEAWLWLPSERVAEMARARGRDKVQVMKSLDEDSVVRALSEWHHP